MSITTDEYVKRAEECERLAGACIAESNCQILLYAAAQWRMLSEAETGAVPTLPRKGDAGSGGFDDAASVKSERAT